MNRSRRYGFVALLSFLGLGLSWVMAGIAIGLENEAATMILLFVFPLILVLLINYAQLMID